MRLADPGRLKVRLEFRPDGDEQQQRQICGASRDRVEQIKRCRVDPVSVLDHDQPGRLRGPG
ncbi:hypothetical protein [Bradyrhizobium japonicum]|uniref:hypothetical protein n=1 Tax=Bradyrhizobium japonicum TaxID=375 RepID=UPI0028A1A062|nr:hypothetical protein [Bradyrhizobium japonicum]